MRLLRAFAHEHGRDFDIRDCTASAFRRAAPENEHRTVQQRNCR
jgi:hypothetical protein